VSPTPQEIFERWIWYGMSRDAGAQAEMFTADGVYEAPLVLADSVFPRRLEGREEIRTGLAAMHQRLAQVDLAVNVAESRYVLHTTADPDVFIAEIDTALDVAGEAATMSLVHIFRLRDGKIALMRDYFVPEQAG
jgi:ketosteroid isomerase-like protein